MKNRKIYIYIYIYLKQNRGEENNIRRAHTSTWLKKKYWGLICFYSDHD